MTGGRHVEHLARAVEGAGQQLGQHGQRPRPADRVTAHLNLMPEALRIGVGQASRCEVAEPHELPTEVGPVKRLPPVACPVVGEVR